MALEQRDLEAIEGIVHKIGGRNAVSMGFLVERLETRIDAVESRLYAKLAEAEDKIESCRVGLADEFSDQRQMLREIGDACRIHPLTVD